MSVQPARRNHPGPTEARASRSRLPRRDFLAMSGAAAGALALGACSWSDAVRDSVAASTSTTTPPPVPAPTTSTTIAPGARGRPLLVVVNLAGGNDGLNTVVPISGRYHDLRPDVGLSDGSLIELGSGFGLHPSLAPLEPFWQAGELAAVHGVGIPGQTRSHFAATDAWAAASTGYSPTGWLGRWLDTHPDAGLDPLLAVGLGGGRAAVSGLTASSTVINRPDQFLLQTAPGMDASDLADVLLATSSPAPSDSDARTLVRAGIPKATNAVQILTEIGADPGITGLDASTAHSLLAVAARVVALNLSTEIITIEVGGFDTHAQQLGTHATLLDDVATGIATLFDDLAANGVERDVLVLTTSEFGRRAEDNGSGTDHGSAGAHLLIGSSVNGGQIVGDPGLDALDDGDLPITIDTRSLYANALDHLGGDPADVLDGEWDRYGLT